MQQQLARRPVDLNITWRGRSAVQTVDWEDLTRATRSVALYLITCAFWAVIFFVAYVEAIH